MEHGPRGKGRQARTVDAPPSFGQIALWQHFGTSWGTCDQAYYLPPGVKRGPGAELALQDAASLGPCSSPHAAGKKNRVDYFDSKKLVLQLLSCDEGGKSFGAPLSRRGRAGRP